MSLLLEGWPPEELSETANSWTLLALQIESVNLGYVLGNVKLLHTPQLILVPSGLETTSKSKRTIKTTIKRIFSNVVK